MAYSDDTAEFMFSGRPTMTELTTPTPDFSLCDSCQQRLVSIRITYRDGATYRLCADCQPDPRQMREVAKKGTP